MADYKLNVQWLEDGSKYPTVSDSERGVLRTAATEVDKRYTADSPNKKL